MRTFHLLRHRSQDVKQGKSTQTKVCTFAEIDKSHLSLLSAVIYRRPHNQESGVQG